MAIIRNALNSLPGAPGAPAPVSGPVPAMPGLAPSPGGLPPGAPAPDMPGQVAAPARPVQLPPVKVGVAFGLDQEARPEGGPKTFEEALARLQASLAAHAQARAALQPPPVNALMGA